MSNNTSPVGKTFMFDLGDLRVNYSFDAHDKASFVVENGAGLAPDGHTETVAGLCHQHMVRNIRSRTNAHKCHGLNRLVVFGAGGGGSCNGGDE